MYLFDRQQIPLALIQDRDEDAFDFEEAVGLLIITYPFLDVQASLPIQLEPDLPDPNSNSCDIHPLIQSSTREWLGCPENNKFAATTKAVASVAKAFLRGSYNNWPCCQLLFPHANSMLQYSSDELNIPLQGENQDN